MNRWLLPLLFLSLVTATPGCSGGESPPEEDDSSEGAITADQAAKSYDGATKLIAGASASPAVQSLGVVKWTAFTVAKGKFAGAVVFGVDAQGDVKYGLLIPKGAKNDPVEVGTFQLDKAGKDAGRVDAAVVKVLVAEVPELVRQIQASARASCTSAGLTALQAAAVALTTSMGVGQLPAFASGAFATMAVTDVLLLTGLVGVVALGGFTVYVLVKSAGAAGTACAG